MTQRILIIGGGITGLSAALALYERAEAERLDIQCTVLEASQQFGGKIETYREGGFVLEGGPDSLLARKTAGIDLIRRLGLESEVVPMNPQAQRVWIVRDQRLVPMPRGTSMGIPVDLPAFMQNELLSARGKARALMDLALPGRSKDGDESLGSFLRRRFGDEMVDWLFDPLLAGIYAGSADQLSLLATFPDYAELERRYGSLIRGTIAQRQRRLQESPPSVAHSESGRSAFITLRGGLRTLIERLHDLLYEWADLRTSAPAIGMARKPEGGYRVATPSGTLEADAVLLATPAFVAAKLLSGVAPSARALEQIPYVSTATIVLAYPAGTGETLADGSGFIVPRMENTFMTACTWVSNKWPHTTPEGFTVLRCFVGRAGQSEGLALSDSELVQAVREELNTLLGIKATPWFTRVTRWPDAMPQYLVNHLSVVDRAMEGLAKEAPGVFLAGAGYRGVGIPDCIASGQQAAAEMLSFLRPGPRT